MASTLSSFLFHQRCLIPRSSGAGNALRLRSMMTLSRPRSDSMYHHGAAVVYSNSSPAGLISKDDLVADEKQFCHTILPKVSPNFAPIIHQLNGTQLRDAVCIYYLVLRALDTVEDDTSIPTDIKVPILNGFHRHIYDSTWHFPCGTRQNDKVLMDEFRHLSTAFLGLEKSYREAIEDITKEIGAGMAKFICKEVETVDDYDEYCHYVTGIAMIGFSRLFHISGLEDSLHPDTLTNSIGLFYQKAHIIKDYFDDINEIPKPLLFWPREIWSKYVAKLEDLKEEEKSEKAVQCLNDMVTNALIHAEDCLVFLSPWKEPSQFRFHAIQQITTMGNLALFYDNTDVFRGSAALSRGVIDRIRNETKSMVDVYGAFFDFSCILKSKVNKKDPNATLTLSRLDVIQKACTDSGLLNNKRKLYVV